MFIFLLCTEPNLVLCECIVSGWTHSSVLQGYFCIFMGDKQKRGWLWPGNFSPCSHIRVTDNLIMFGVHCSPSTALGCALSKADCPWQGVHAFCYSGLELSKLILGSKSCLAAKYSKQSTLLSKYFATLPESIPEMSGEKASQCKFIKVQEIILSAAEGQIKHLLAGIGYFDCKDLYNMQFCTGSRQSGF